MKQLRKRVLITGGAGFIGSHLVRQFVRKYQNYTIVNVDALTYSGSLENVKDIKESSNYTFIQQNINNTKEVTKLLKDTKPDWIIHLAAESHVDRSIDAPKLFLETNVLGTVNLLEGAISLWGKENKGTLFYQISTDEVYGSLSLDGGLKFSETTPYNPKSPYAASKAAADHFVRSFGNTYNLPYVISSCSNNYGPNQHPEKLIPKTIQHILQKKAIPIFGRGENSRDWIYVKDHVSAIETIAHLGKRGQTYNVGANNECDNFSLVKRICQLLDKYVLNQNEGTSERLISFVEDRPGHDLRYAIDNQKIKKTLQWHPTVSFNEGLKETVLWYAKKYNNS